MSTDRLRAEVAELQNITMPRRDKLARLDGYMAEVRQAVVLDTGDRRVLFDALCKVVGASAAWVVAEADLQ